MGGNKSEYKFWGTIKQWRPHEGVVCQSFVTFVPLFFPIDPTGQTSLSPITHYAFLDVVPSIHDPFGGSSH